MAGLVQHLDELEFTKDRKKSALFFIYLNYTKTRNVEPQAELFPTPKSLMQFCEISRTKKKNPGAFMASLLNIYFR